MRKTPWRTCPWKRKAPDLLSFPTGKDGKKLDKSENIAEISKHLVYTDTMVEKAIAFIIENSVLPRIETLKRVVH